MTPHPHSAASPRPSARIIDIDDLLVREWDRSNRLVAEIEAQTEHDTAAADDLADGLADCHDRIARLPCSGLAGLTVKLRLLARLDQWNREPDLDTAALRTALAALERLPPETTR
ncbi:MAG: hypothetical protein HQL42_13060 [Alphaproteobacteria bacterium]|nr:hypothetical protein [Alphaproteobacteria bacterium]